MIGYLVGEAMEQQVVMTSGGVGYVVETPASLAPGEPVRLYITTIVREDAIKLYGFETQADQHVFGTLLKVPSIGPAVALSLLRDVGTTQLARAVHDRNPLPLAQASGVGKKTAERIVAQLDPAVFAALELETEEGSGEVGTGLLPEPVREVIETLVGLRFDEKAATEAVRAAWDSGEQEDGELLAKALARLRGAA